MQPSEKVGKGLKSTFLWVAYCCGVVSGAISPTVFQIPNSPPQICEGDALSVDNILILELDSLISDVTERKLPYSSALWCKTRFDNNFLINEIMYINVAYAVSGTW